ncbi:IclR family transcriptional regulator domain-containing protein [Angustibacter sp. McL0619]|uniref:IclR family transcriptional regulator domain-containing protein n=1 Tax=Angustibacter sp. McL0619 TaxID=3415676 RepID=UPI003CF83F99
MTGTRSGTTRPARDERTQAVVDALLRDGRALPLSEIARRLDLAKSTTHRTLAAMVAAGDVGREGRLYRLLEGEPGRANQRLTARRADARRALSAPVGRLFTRTQLTVSAAVLNGRLVDYAYRIHGRDELWTGSDQTGQGPVLGSAAGCALLAWDPPAALRVAERHGLHPGERAQLRRELADVRRARVAVHADPQSHALCFAMPVFDAQARPWAALVVRGRRGRVDVSGVVHLLRSAARSAGSAISATG